MSSVFVMACVLSLKLGGVGLLLPQGAPRRDQAKPSARPLPDLSPVSTSQFSVC